MYFISILAIILVTIIAGASSVNLHFEALWDTPSLLIILLICIPILISAGLFKDFNNAFRIALNRKKDRSLIEIKRSIEAVNLAIRTLLCSGLFLFILTLFVILRGIEDLALLGPQLAVAILICFYSLALAIILLPIKSILEIRVIEFMPEHANRAEHEETAEQKEAETE